MKKSYVQLCLRHNWGQAVLAEGSVLCVQAALRLLEMATLAVLGTPTGVAWYPDPLGRDALIQGVVLLAAAGLDLLVLSPFKLSREALYWQLGAAWRPQPPGSWRRYWGAGRYGQALAWRLHRWARFAWVLFWCWLPALVLLWTGERLRLDSLRHGAADLTGAAFLLLGVAALAVGAAAAALWMLRVRPAACLVAQGVPVGRAFRLSPPLMKGHIASFVHLYARYAWKVLSCVLVFPALYVLPLLHTEQACRLRKWVKMPPTIEKTTILW